MNQYQGGYNYWVNKIAYYGSNQNQFMNNSYNQGFNEINNNYIYKYNNNINFQTFYDYSRDIEYKLYDLFSNETLAKLRDENEIIKYFYEKELECIEYINNKFYGDENSMKLLNEKLLFIFYHNPNIEHKTENIYCELDSIDLQKFDSELKLKQKLNSLYKYQLPNFLIKPYLDNLGYILLKKGENLKDSLFLRKGDKPTDTQLFIEMYENLQSGKNIPFESLTCKKELYNLLILVNYEYLTRPYFKDIFINFLLLNLKEVEKMDCDLYYGLSDESQIKLEKPHFLKKVDSEIDGDKKIIFDIIVSLYKRLIYEFKDNSNKSKSNNIDNVYVNFILKNFVIFLDEKYSKQLDIDPNLFELLKILYKFNIEDLVEKKKYPTLKSHYKFEEIDEILSKNELVSKKYKIVRDELSNNEHKKENFIKAYWKKGWKWLGYEPTDELYKYITYLSLKQMKFINSNTITILIDGFRTQNRNEMTQWSSLIGVLNEDTIIYFYKWPSGNAGFNMINHFCNSKERAKYTGQLLALILDSKQFFNGFQINLIGFSLGNHVITNCLMKLYELESNIKLKNVICIAGATQMDDKDKWKKIIEKIVVDRFINCYSKKDEILAQLYVSATGNNNPIGLSEVIIKNDKKMDLVHNYQFGYGHLEYDYEVVAKKIFNSYKDI